MYQVLSQNIDIKCLKSGGQKHLKGPLLGMPAVNEKTRSKNKDDFLVNGNLRILSAMVIVGVGVFRKDFQNFKTFFESNSGKFNSQKCNRFKKVYSYKDDFDILSVFDKIFAKES
jgi:hypothetical protein